jgi:hypothetical protein
MTVEELLTSLSYMWAPKGRDLVEEWDKQEWVRDKPEERAYGQDTRRFWRDFRRARQGVAYPHYEWPDEL